MYIKSLFPLLCFALSHQAYSVDLPEFKENKQFLDKSVLFEKENFDPNSPLLKRQKITQESEKKIQPSQDICVGFSADLLEFEKQARHQYAETLFKIGCHHENGEGVPQNLGKAYSYYVQAANLDYIPAFHNLGCFYSDPDFGVQINYSKAIRYHQYALSNGCKDSAFSLGVLFAEGKGCKQSYKTAFDYFKVAEESGRKHSYKTAFDYLSRTAEKGDEENFYFLGLCYAEGFGVDRNLERAFAYFSKAAEKGYALALYKVGLSHYQGQGTDKNDLMALDFMTQARRLGVKEAEIFLQEYILKASLSEKKKKAHVIEKKLRNVSASTKKQIKIKSP